MKERPVNMRAEEVRAILAGRKTQFRRVINPQPEAGSSCPYHIGTGKDRKARVCPFGKPGDRLWVRETWAPLFEEDTGFCGVQYAAGGMAEEDKRAGEYLDGTDRWRSPVCMPRKLSRITLEIASVRVERLQDISEEDAIAEWCSPLSERCRRTPICGSDDWPEFHGSHRENFRCWWGSIYGPEDWTENPWVWVMEFKVTEGGNQ